MAKVAKKSVKKPAPRSKPASKPAAKPAAKRPPAKAAPKPAPKPVSKVPAKPAASAKPAPAPAPAAVGKDAKNKPKGITIVSPKPMKKPKVKKTVEMPSLGAPLLGPGIKKWKPLIPSGPNAPNVNGPGLGMKAGAERPKSKLDKKELERFRQILLKKRSDLVGDVSRMEGEALRGNSGSLSHTPQHIAEQGSEAYEQSLALDLASVDRNLIREIDDALKRIDNGTFGICQLSGKPISKERLEELPWTRYSIEAAREHERRSYIA